jgi:hypothetical protein
LRDWVRPASGAGAMKAANAFAALLDADAAPAKPAGKRGKAPAAPPPAPPKAAAPNPAEAPRDEASHAGWTDSSHRRNRSAGGGSSNGGTPAAAPAGAEAGRTAGRAGEAASRERKQAEPAITAASAEAEAAAAAGSAEARLQLLHSWTHVVRRSRLLFWSCARTALRHALLRSRPRSCATPRARARRAPRR